MKICISNPPFNLRWKPPIFAQLQERFAKTEIPPESNANYAFILTAIQECEKSYMIFSNNILTSSQEKEQEIRKYLIEKNYIEAVITCPENMFESTTISVCVIVLNKNKKTSKTVLIDARNFCDKEKRKQKGQKGRNINRMYEKEFNVFNDNQINEIKETIDQQKNKKDFSKVVTIEDMKEKNYMLQPSIYFDITVEEPKTRAYEDIINDINYVNAKRNRLKLTINEKIAKTIGLYEIAEINKSQKEKNKEINKGLKELGLNLQIEKTDYLQLSKRKNEIKFENNSKEEVSSVLMMILNGWKTMVYSLNKDENKYLAELGDKLSSDLFSGKLEFKETEEEK